MPRYLPTFLVALLAAGLLLKGITELRTYLARTTLQFMGPGDYHFMAPAKGTFTLWLDSIPGQTNEISFKDQKLPPGIQVSIQHAGQPILVEANEGSYENVMGHEKLSMSSFTVPEPGEYLIRLSGFQQPRAFALAPGRGLEDSFRMLGWLTIGSLFSTFSVALLVLALKGIFPTPRPPERSPFLQQ